MVDDRAYAKVVIALDVDLDDARLLCYPTPRHAIGIYHFLFIMRITE